MLLIPLTMVSYTAGCQDHWVRWCPTCVDSILPVEKELVRYLSVNITSPRTIRFGVLQGCVLRLLLFTLYTADIGRIIPARELFNRCYAYDTKADFFSVGRKTVQCWRHVWRPVVDDIDRRFACNRLKLNPDRSEFLWSAAAHRRHLVDNIIFRFEDGGDTTLSTAVRKLDAFVTPAAASFQASTD